MHRAFVVVYDESRELGGMPRTPDEIHRIDADSLSATKLFSFRGHGLPLEVRLRDAYPEILAGSRYLLFTFLAEPLRSEASGYTWYLNQADGHPKASFAEVLRARRSNLYASAMGCKWWNYRRVLKRYFFLGVSEQAPAAVDALAAKTDELFASAAQTPNVARARYFMREYVRKPDADSEDRAEQIAEVIARLDPAEKSAFERRNRLDYWIYAHSRERLAADIRRLRRLAIPEPAHA